MECRVTFPPLEQQLPLMHKRNLSQRKKSFTFNFLFPPEEPKLALDQLNAYINVRFACRFGNFIPTGQNRSYGKYNFSQIRSRNGWWHHCCLLHRNPHTGILRTQNALNHQCNLIAIRSCSIKSLQMPQIHHDFQKPVGHSVDVLPHYMDPRLYTHSIVIPIHHSTITTTTTTSIGLWKSNYISHERA